VAAPASADVSVPPFDPSSAPVLAAAGGSSEKPLSDQRLQGDWIRQRFLHPPSDWRIEAESNAEAPSGQPPGAPAVSASPSSASPSASVWAPQGPAGERASRPDATAMRPLTPAAVLVPLLPTPQGLGVLLTVRSNRLRHHRGQIAFPGGRLDPEDASATDGALREAAEEIGLARHQVQVLGSLPGMATGTGYWVNPVVGLLDAAVQPQSLVLSPQEVQEAFVVPLAFLMNPANHQRRLGCWQQDGQIIQRAFHAMPWQAPAGHTYFIWGATATMLRNFYHFLAA
jgi:hydrolase, NUDIX family